VDNDVTMSVPPGTAFNGFSAGIGVYGFAQNNVVLHNRIRGSARAALSIPAPFPLSPPAAVPQDNAFIENDFVEFAPSLADIFVGQHALRTLIVGLGSVECVKTLTATATCVDLGDQTTTRPWRYGRNRGQRACENHLAGSNSRSPRAAPRSASAESHVPRPPPRDTCRRPGRRECLRLGELVGHHASCYLKLYIL
jgi:hypothetical protein